MTRTTPTFTNNMFLEIFFIIKLNKRLNLGCFSIIEVECYISWVVQRMKY